MDGTTVKMTTTNQTPGSVDVSVPSGSALVITGLTAGNVNVSVSRDVLATMT